MYRPITLVIALLMLLVPIGMVSSQDQPVGSGVVTGDLSGYVLFMPMASEQVYLVDGQGRIVHDWVTNGPGFDVALRDNGNLVVAMAKNNPDQAYFEHIQYIGTMGRIEEYTWDGELVWAYELERPSYRVHHGIEVLPNGNVMFIAWNHKTHEEAIAAGRDPELLGSVGLWPDVILEYSPAQDDIVWEWHAWDHIIQDFDPDKDNYGVVADNPQLIDLNFFVPPEDLNDWHHTNAVDYHPQLDQIVISVREFNEFWVIDHSISTEEARGEAGDLLYRWGNPAAYDRGDESDRHISYQHDVNWVPEGYPGAGNFVLFSNRHITDAEDEYSSVVEVTPPLLPDGTYELTEGQAYGPEEPTWIYDGLPDHLFFSRFISGAERMPDGNTFVTSGMQGHLFAVNPAGEVVWEYLPPINGIALLTSDLPESARAVRIFRAKYYEPDYPAFAGRDLTNAVLPDDLATTSVRYPGFLDRTHENTLSSEFPARYYAVFVRTEEATENTFSVEVLEGNIDPVVTILNRDLEPLVEDDNSGDDRNARIEDYVPDIGWMYVIVSHADEDATGVEGRFRLVREVEARFADVSPDIPRITYGSSIQDTISDEDTESFFVFFGQQGQQISVRMQRDNASLDPVVELLDADREVLISASADTELPVAQIESYTLPANGIYFIRATRYTGDDRASDTTGVYTFELNLIEP